MSKSSDWDIQVQNEWRERRMYRRLEALGWIASCIAVAGVILNNNRIIWCFALWIVSNSLTAFIHVRKRMWALSARDLVFLVLAVVGWASWSSGQ